LIARQVSLPVEDVESHRPLPPAIVPILRRSAGTKDDRTRRQPTRTTHPAAHTASASARNGSLVKNGENRRKRSKTTGNRSASNASRCAGRGGARVGSQ
jgi:hypothetical protein